MEAEEENYFAGKTFHISSKSLVERDIILRASPPNTELELNDDSIIIFIKFYPLFSKYEKYDKIRLADL